MLGARAVPGARAVLAVRPGQGRAGPAGRSVCPARGRALPGVRAAFPFSPGSLRSPRAAPFPVGAEQGRAPLWAIVPQPGLPPARGGMCGVFGRVRRGN